MQLKLLSTYLKMVFALILGSQLQELEASPGEVAY